MNPYEKESIISHYEALVASNHAEITRLNKTISDLNDKKFKLENTLILAEILVFSIGIIVGLYIARWT